MIDHVRLEVGDYRRSKVEAAPSMTVLRQARKKLVNISVPNLVGREEELAALLDLVDAPEELPSVARVVAGRARDRQDGRCGSRGSKLAARPGISGPVVSALGGRDRVLVAG